MGGKREDRMTVDLTAIEIERRLTAIETTLETTLLQRRPTSTR